MSVSLMEETEDMDAQTFIKKFKTNPFFKTKVKMMIKEFNSRKVPESSFSGFGSKNQNLIMPFVQKNDYGVQKTLKDQRIEFDNQGKMIQQQWIYWLRQAGIQFEK